MKTYVTFQLNGQSYGVEILYVREINRHLDITAVQHAPACLVGLANLRGQIVTIIDLACILEQESAGHLTDNILLIMRSDTELIPIRNAQKRPDLISIPDSIGFLINRVDEIISLDDSEIEAPPSNLEKAEAHYLSGVAKLSDRIVGILDVPRLLMHEPSDVHNSAHRRIASVESP